MATLSPASAIAPPIEVVIAAEGAQRAKYARLERAGRNDAEPVESIREVVVGSAVFLELVLLAAVTFESLDRLGLDPTRPSDWPRERLWAEIRSSSGLDPARVAHEATTTLGLSAPTDGELPPMSRDALVRSVRSVLDTCPIHAIEDEAAKRDLESWGHRARRAFDGLQAFLFRMDPVVQEQVRILGREYAAGHMSLEEVAKLLDVHPVDAVAWLEQGGYRRSLDTISLDEAERSEIYRRMREERLARDGPYEPSAEEVSRDVVASERIEGVDARSWIPRQGS